MLLIAFFSPSFISLFPTKELSHHPFHKKSLWMSSFSSSCINSIISSTSWHLIMSPGFDCFFVCWPIYFCTTHLAVCRLLVIPYQWEIYWLFAIPTWQYSVTKFVHNIHWFERFWYHWYPILSYRFEQFHLLLQSWSQLEDLIRRYSLVNIFYE